MAKKSSPYANIVVPKKVLDKPTEVVDNVAIEVIPQEVKDVMANIKQNTVVEFNPTLNAYVPYHNIKTKKYELITASIDPVTNRVEIFRKELPKCDNMNSAIMEMQKQYANDAVAKVIEQRRKEREG